MLHLDDSPVALNRRRNWDARRAGEKRRWIWLLVRGGILIETLRRRCLLRLLVWLSTDRLELQTVRECLSVSMGGN